jgi:hypothetical protein
MNNAFVGGEHTVGHAPLKTRRWIGSVLYPVFLLQELTVVNAVTSMNLSEHRPSKSLRTPRHCTFQAFPP